MHTLFSLFTIFEMSLPSRKKLPCLVQFTCSSWRGQGTPQTHISNSLHLDFFFLGYNKSHLSCKHKAASYLQIFSIYPKTEQFKGFFKNVKSFYLSSSNINCAKRLYKRNVTRFNKIQSVKGTQEKPSAH